MRNTKQSFTKTNGLKIIFFSGLLVGSLDILAALIDYYIATGKGPSGVLKFIASGVFGRKAFSGGTGMILMGLLFHFAIGFLFTILFYWLYSRIKFMRVSRILTGILYGILIWVVMNRLVLPLSNTPPLPFKLAKAVKAMLILSCMIGLPLSFIMHKYFLRRVEEGSSL